MNPALTDILTKLMNSDDTTVGGGCASALSGAMAAGMVSMVAKLSKKKPAGLTPAQYDEIAAECDDLVLRLEQGCAEDARAYRMIVDAYKLPKDTEEQLAARRAAVQVAAVRAAEVPRDNGVMCARVHELGTMLKGRSNPACLSDLTSALYLSEGGVKDCVLNIRANLGMIRDPEVCSRLKEDMLDLLLKAICY